MVGTFGFMAPEQFQGRAGPSSDVYAVAATALSLLSGREPEDLPHKGLSIDVLAYNSKVYYVVTDGGGNGEQVYRVPATGGDLQIVSMYSGRGVIHSILEHMFFARGLAW